MEDSKIKKIKDSKIWPDIVKPLKNRHKTFFSLCFRLQRYDLFRLLRQKAGKLGGFNGFLIVGKLEIGIRDWLLGIGYWGLVIGDWELNAPWLMIFGIWRIGIDGLKERMGHFSPLEGRLRGVINSL